MNNFKKFIPKNPVTYINYLYVDKTYEYELNLIIENDETLKELDKRLFSKGMIGYKSLRGALEAKEMTQLEISKNLALENNKITADMFKKIKDEKLVNVQFKEIPKIDLSPNKIINSDIKIIDVAKSEILLKIENLNTLFLHKNYIDFLNNFNKISLEIKFPKYKNESGLHILYEKMGKLAFENGYIKTENNPVPLYINNISPSKNKNRLHNKFLNILYNKIIFLEDKDIPIFICALYMIENFNPDLFKLYNKPFDIINNFKNIISNNKVKEGINDIVTINNGARESVYYVFAQQHGNYNFKKDEIYKQILTNIF